MEILATLDETQRLTFIKILAKLTAVDGHIDEIEKDFVSDLAIRYGIPSSRMAEIWQETSVDELAKEAEKINNRGAALLLVKEMCMLAHADDELSDEEVFLIGRIGEAMGVSPQKVQDISNWVIERLIWLERGRLIFEEVSPK